MRRSMEHVPATERSELERIIQMILEEFQDVVSLAQREWRTTGSITKVVLYGSHARGDWLDEHHTHVGRHSDWDLIVLVNDERLTDRVRYWGGVSERLHRENRYTHRLRSPVQYFVYTIEQINASLASGRYFFIDIVRDGIIVYETDDAEFASPKPLPAERVFLMSQSYFDDWFESAVEFYENYEFAIEKGRLKNAAFQLHQCVERLYHTILLTRTLYTPHNHNIGELRSASENLNPELREAWPREVENDVLAFEKLQQAYVKARYIKDFHISEAQLSWAGRRVKVLISIVRRACEDHIAALKESVPAPRR